MFDASVFSLGPVRGRELLVAESLVIRYVIVHSRLVRTAQGARLFKIDQIVRAASSVAQQNAQQRAMHSKRPIIIDEAQLPEFVHEEADPGSRCPDHFRERLLTNFCGDRLGPAFLAEVGKQEERAGQALLTGIH